MRVIVPHVRLDPATEFFLKYHVDRRLVEVEFVRYEPEQTDAYWEAINKEWEKGEGFINVEGDILPWPGAIEEIAFCHHELCNFWAPAGWQYDHYVMGYGLGCTKFSAGLIYNHRNIMQEIAHSELGKTWQHLDGQLLNGLLQRGVAQHFHSPAVAHLNRSKYPDA